MDLVLGNHRKEIHMKEIGFKIDNMVKEYLNIELVHIKDNSIIFLRMGEGHRNFLMAINMKDSTSWVSHQEEVDMNGLMVDITKDNFERVYDRVVVN
jgi:hypothetical protein